MLLLVTAGAVLAGLYRWPWWSPAAIAGAGAFGQAMVIYQTYMALGFGFTQWTNKSIEFFGMYLVVSYALYYLMRGLVRGGAWIGRKIRGDRSASQEVR